MVLVVCRSLEKDELEKFMQRLERCVIIDISCDFDLPWEEGVETMATSKRRALERAGLLNRKAGRVRAPLFGRVAFFDADDKLQAKYEMLRSHEADGLPVSRTAELFGYTRQAYYQIRQAFDEQGMAGLLDKKRGRRGPVKCTPEVVAFLVRQKQADPELSGRELAEQLEQERGVVVHRRTVEKIVAGLGRPRRHKKKPAGGA